MKISPIFQIHIYTLLRWLPRGTKIRSLRVDTDLVPRGNIGVSITVQGDTLRAAICYLFLLYSTSGRLFVFLLYFQSSCPHFAFPSLLLLLDSSPLLPS
jgi:hypothetical protein